MGLGLSAVLGLAACNDEKPADGNACPAVASTLSSLRVTVEGSKILDATGREVILRGVNAGGRSKMPPFLPFAFQESGMANQADAAPFDEALTAYADRVQSWGHNTVRLPFTWEAVEPERGTYDEAFVERYIAMARAFGERGIRVIVDYHQDVFARPMCGDGFPLWAILEPLEEPLGNCHQWFLGYLNEGPVQRAYDSFWNNEDGLRDALTEMWRYLAPRLWEVEGVIGFEVINEPGWGTMPMEQFMPQVMTPFYTEMAAAIEEVAPGALVFFDSTGLEAVQAVTSLELPEGDSLVFAPHYYDPQAILQGMSPGHPDYLEPLGQWRSQGDAWDVPVLVGEFGIKATADGGGEYVRLNFDAMDAHGLHCTLWEYSSTVDDWNDEGMSIYTPEGGEQPTALESIRAYPDAIAGTLVSFEFDRETGVGTVVYEGTADGVSAIAVPTRLYPDGVEASFETGDGCTAVDADTQRLYVHVPEAGTVTLRFGPISE
jgi:endoglycosylceramidase